MLKVKPDDYFNILCHGSAKRIIINGKKLKPEELILKLEEMGYSGQKIRLISCHTGAKETGFAQKLATLLKVEVIAPTKQIKINKVAEFVHFKGGKFKTFNP